jgi:IMP cyclohydrolase
MYLGRIVGVGRNCDGHPYIATVASARSDDNRKRIYVPDDYRGEHMIRMDSTERKKLGWLKSIFDSSSFMDGKLSLPRKQWEDRMLIFYDAINADDASERAIASNGRQTDWIKQKLEGGAYDDIHLSMADGFLTAGGAESDGERTPRIAAILNSKGDAILGIVTDRGMCMNAVELPSEGRMKYLTTYKGSPSDNREIVKIGLELPAGEVDIHGRNAQEIAGSLYRWMDPQFVICAAVARWNPDLTEWEIGKRNFHGQQ